MTDQTSGRQLIIPSLAGVYDSLAPRGYSLMRFSTGAIVIYHGYLKLFAGMAPMVGDRLLGPMGFPAPHAWAYFLGLLEFVGGAMMAVGLLTRPIALMFAVEMAIVTFGVHFKNGYAFSSPGGGYEYPLLLMGLNIGILLAGSGRCAIDRVIGKEF
jgi:putative oxidoreductase